MGSKRAGIREILEPISDVLGLPMKIGISGQVSGKGKGAYPVLGDMKLGNADLLQSVGPLQ